VVYSMFLMPRHHAKNQRFLVSSLIIVWRYFATKTSGGGIIEAEEHKMCRACREVTSEEFDAAPVNNDGASNLLDDVDR